MKKVFFHIDIDAFFASVEKIDRPELEGLPLVVGALPGQRGVVSTCSYEARAFGLHSAMPISEAARLCPGAIFLPVRMERYAEVSETVMAIFADFTPDVIQTSIDEAFLDMSGTERLWGSPEKSAKLIKRRVKIKTGLGISIGVAPNPYVAKIASGLRKPDGLVIVPEGEESSFMLGLPLSKIWGAGEKTRQRLRGLGISSAAELAAMDRSMLISIFGRAGGDFLYEAVRGREAAHFGFGQGPEGIVTRERRSISAEHTFERDMAERDVVEAMLLELADGLMYRLWSLGASSRTLMLKLRYHDFTTITRRRGRGLAYRLASEACDDAKELLETLWDRQRPLRLIGLGFLLPDGEGDGGQGELFAEPMARRARAQEAIFAIERSGLGKLRRARNLGSRRDSG